MLSPQLFAFIIGFGHLLSDINEHYEQLGHEARVLLWLVEFI